MTRSLWVPGRFPGLNDIIEASSRNHHGWNRLKKAWSAAVVLAARVQGFDKIRTPAHFEFKFSEPNRRRDPDNLVGGGVKIALDALVQAGLLSDDGWDEVASISATWALAPGRPGVTVVVREVLGRKETVK